MNEWISVKDRLPEDGAWVLMYLKTYTGSDAYRAGIWFNTGQGQWLSAANAYEGVGCLTTEQVTHWMLLPKPPEQQRKNP